MKRVLAAVIVATFIGVPMAGDPVVGGMVNVRMIIVVQMAGQVAVIEGLGNGAPTFNQGQEVVNGDVVSAGRHVLLVRVLVAVIEVRYICRFALGILSTHIIYLLILTISLIQQSTLV